MLKLSLRTKYFLYSNALIVVTMSLVTILALNHERKVHYEAIESRGLGLTQALAIPITDALMYEDLGLVTEEGLISNYISEILARNEDLMRYVVVTDTRERVTHSNRWQLLGRQFSRALPDVSIGQGAVIDIREEPDERILEVRTPLNISTKYWGSLAVGFSLAPIDREVSAVVQQWLLVGVLLILGNSLLNGVYMELMLRPILSLHRGMKRAGKGDLRVRVHPRRDDEVGELSQAFNRMMDELEEARDTEKARQTQLAHTEKMVAMGTLAAGVAHEVNNPLGGILTCIESLRANPDDREMRERYLDLTHDGLKRIEHATLGLLDFSRQRPMTLEPTSVNHNLRHLLELVAYQLRRGNIETVLDLDPDEPMVMGDHFQLEQLYLNLVLNAIQAMPDRGTLTLRTFVKDDMVVAEVGDTGTGIPPEIRDRIFDPFFTTREVGEGTGLGLTVSHSIVAAHGGLIEVESTMGAGTVFRTSFPALKAPAAEEDGR